MLGRILRLNLAIDWRRVTLVVVCAVIAAVLPVVGLPLILGRKAVLVVAHRLSAVERADCVVMLEHGKIVERGTHAELIGAGGPYARMHRATRPD